jgi:hypothetical protein
MNDLDTSVLTARLTELADDMAPAVDPRRQVADARARHHRKRRIRITLVAVATATAAVAVGTVSAVDLLSVDQSRDVATPTDPTPTEPTTAPTPTPTPTPPPAPVEPAAWESRSLMGLEFAVPPGARTADTVDDVPVSQWEGPTFTWNGPLLGGDDYSFVSVKVTDAYEGGLPPLDGGDWYTVPGADDAYGAVGEPGSTLEELDPVDHTFAMMAVLVGDRVFHVNAWFPSGADGQQMAQRLIASLAATPAPPGDRVDVHQPSTDWESRTLQDITFSVPPGSSAPEYRSDSTLIWYGPEVGGQPTTIGVEVSQILPGPSAPDGYAPIAVPGADDAWLMTDIGTMNEGKATFNMWMVKGDRSMNLGGTIPLGPRSEETMQRVIASVVIG